MQHFNSFSELAWVFGVRPKAQQEKPVYCRVCGCQMDRVGDSNVYFCHGKTNDGKNCTNRLIKAVSSHVYR